MTTLDQIVHTRFSQSKGSYFSPVARYIAGFFVVVINSIAPHPLIAIISILLIVAMLILFCGVEVNLNSMQYRDYFKLGPFKFGKWKQLSQPDYLYISKTQKRKQIPILGSIISFTNSTVYYDLDLITKGDRDVLLYSALSRDKTVALANEIADDHQLKIGEKISGEYIWLRE